MPKKTYERRSFLKLMGTGLGAGLVNLPGIANTFTSSAAIPNYDYILGKPQWFLHEDGTFDIWTGKIRLSNCRPSINGQSIFVRNTFMGDSPKGKRIIYEIEGGFVMLDLRTHSNMISIGAEISGMKNAPTWFNPLGEGLLTGANRFYKLGLGTGGQSGIFEFPKSTKSNSFRFPDEQAWSYDSFLMTGLIADNGDTLAIGAFEQKDFIQRTAIFNRPKRNGLNNNTYGKEEILFEAGFATENIPLKDEFIKLPDLYFYSGNQPYGTMQNLAWSISEQNQARRDSDTNYFWSSSQDFRTSFSYKYLIDQLKLLDELKPALPLQSILIGKGYCIPGDWLDPNDAWPKSMEDAARQIFQRRYRAGISVSPFAAHEKSRVFRNHPRWILKDPEGNPIEMDSDQQGKIYALDGSHNDVQDYLSKVFGSFRKMGFTYFELNNLDWGFLDSAQVQRSKKDKSSVQIFRNVMELIREEVGAGSFITANNTPYSPIIGIVDAVRIEQDHEWNWDEQITRQIIQESYNTQFFNNVFWQNDPDVVFLRDYKSEYTFEEQKSLALWTGFMGGAIGNSDNFKIMKNEKLQLWRFLEPTKRPQSAILPYWGIKTRNKVAIRRYKRPKAWGILILNDSPDPVVETYRISDLTGDKEAWIFVWEPGFSLGLGKDEQITVSLNSHESKLFYVTEQKENPSLNLTISGKEYSTER